MNIPLAKIEKFCVPMKDDEATMKMKCVWLDVEGKRLLATNGHMAVRVSIPVGESDVSGLIPQEAMELARKELKEIRKINKDDIPDPWLSVIANEDSVFIQNLLTNTTHVVLRPKMGVDEKFPQIDAVFPILAREPNISLDVSLLADMIAAMAVESTAASIWIEAADKQVIMASRGLGISIAALMPMRMETGSMDLAEINKRGVSVAPTSHFPTTNEGEKGESDKSETTVSLQVGDIKTEPMPISRFTERCAEAAKDCDLYGQAVRLVREAGKCSVSLLQRKLSLGYGTAAHIIDQMEERGIVGAANGGKPREVLPIIGQEQSAVVN